MSKKSLILLGMLILVMFYSTVVYSEIIRCPETKELHLEGLINGKLKITMVLRVKEDIVQGEYYYDKFKKPIYLLGEIINDSIVLEERTYAGDYTGVFEGKFITSKRIQGYWRDTKSVRKLNFFVNIIEEYIGYQPILDYNETFSKEIKYIAPYVEQFCANEDIDPQKLVIKLLGPLNQLYESDLPVFIESCDHVTSNWSYFVSRTPLIYQIEVLNNSSYFVLYNQMDPRGLVANKNVWQIAIIDRGLTKIIKKQFNLKYTDQICWDIIDTRLRVSRSGEKVVTVITYKMSGTGGGFDQEFTITFNIEKDVIKIIAVKQTKDLS